MSIATKLQKILDSKAAIKAAIAAKGGTITDATPLAEYAQAIEDLPSGSDEELIKVIDNSITSIEIPDGTTKVAAYKFYECSALTSVTIPSSVTVLGSWSFYGCRNLINVVLPNTIQSIKDRSFYYCDKLETVNTLGEITKVEDFTFLNCLKLQAITIPNTVTTVGISAFHQCSALTEIVFPDSVQSFSNQVCRECKNLRDIVIGSGITAIGNSFFSGNNTVTIRIYATTPPTLGTNFVPATYTGKIYVPDASVNDYKTASNWSAYASYISPLSEYTP